MEKLLTRHDVAGIFGVTPRTIDTWRDKRRIPAPVCLPGSNRIRWRRTDINRYIEDLQVEYEGAAAEHATARTGRPAKW